MSPQEGIARANAFHDAHGRLWGVIELPGMEDGDRWTGACYATFEEAVSAKRADYDADDIEALSPGVARWDRDGEFWTYDY